MPEWEGKSRGNKTGYKIFVWILKQGGVRPAYFLLRFVSLYFFFFSFKSSKALFSFYSARMKFGLLRSTFSIYKNYLQLGQSLIDKVALMSGIDNPFSFHFDGEEHLHNMVKQGKGGILISAHIGSWDIAGHLLKRLNTRINIVIFDGEHEQIKSYLESVTGARPVSLIVIKNDLSHIYEISDALKRNELICMHADRFLPGNKVKEQYFLGKPAKFPIGPFVLASTFRVPVSFVFAVKETALHYHFFATVGKEYSGLPKAEVMDAIMVDYVKEMERKAISYPDQWFNFYDFWKT
jgi:predicted LPLAT superfamily acyltransferase